MDLVLFRPLFLYVPFKSIFLGAFPQVNFFRKSKVLPHHWLLLKGFNTNDLLQNRRPFRAVSFTFFACAVMRGDHFSLIHCHITLGRGLDLGSS